MLIKVGSDLLFTSEVLPNICLVDHHHLGGVEISALLGRLHANTETDGDICNGKYHDTDICWGVFSDPRQVSL